jgi:hypothetical protein
LDEVTVVCSWRNVGVKSVIASAASTNYVLTGNGIQELISGIPLITKVL